MGMNIGKYIAGFFKGVIQRPSNTIVKTEAVKEVITKEVPVLLPIPISFTPSNGATWSQLDAENLRVFLETDSGRLFQQYLALKYAKTLLGITDEGVAQARGINSILILVRDLANPANYGSQEQKLLSRINTSWGAGLVSR